MGKVSVCFFLEDNGQESLIPHLVERVIVDEGRDPACFQFRILSARGGISLGSLRRFVDDVDRKGLVGTDAIVVGSDGNCTGFAARRDEIRAITATLHCPAIITAVPDPHIERWFLLDIRALRDAAGVDIEDRLPAYKCDKGRYKRLLREAFAKTEVRPPLGGIEFGPAVAQRLDLYHSAKAEPGLGDFLDQVRAWVKSLATCHQSC